MSRRCLIVGSICAALGVTTAASGAARYVLVDDGWGYECYDSYAHGADMVVALPGGRPIVRGLQAGLDRSVQFVDGGRAVVWSDASGTRLADLGSGRVVLLGRLVRSGDGFVALDRRARVALLVSAGRRGASLMVVTRRARGVHRRAILDADGAQAQLSADGRFLAYTGARGIAVRAVSGGPGRWLGSAAQWWAFARDELGYLDAGVLHVLDARTGAQLLGLPVAASPDGPLGVPSWSPDGHYILLGDGTVADVRARVIRPLPAFATESVAWRPGGGHQLLRSSFVDSDLVDVATGAELWRRDGVAYLRWSPDGRWLLNPDGPPDLLLDHAGAPVSLPGSVGPPVEWLGANMLAVDRARTLLVAAPPRWTPRVLTRGASGHHLAAKAIFTASPAGLRLLARTFRPRAQARDCR